MRLGKEKSDSIIYAVGPIASSFSFQSSFQSLLRSAFQFAVPGFVPSVRAQFISSVHRHSKGSAVQDADEQLKALEKKLRRETKDLENGIRTARLRRRSTAPGPVDEKQTDPWRTSRRDPKEPIRQKIGFFRLSSNAENESLRKERLSDMLNGKLEYKMIEGGSQTSMKVTRTEEVSAIDQEKAEGGTETFLEGDEGGSQTNQKGSREFVLEDAHRTPEDEQHPLWVKGPERKMRWMSDFEFQELQKSILNCLKDPVPVMPREMVDDIRRKLRHENGSDWWEKLEGESYHIRYPWRAIEHGTSWETLKNRIIQLTHSCPKFKDLSSLYELLGQQHSRIIMKFFSREVSRHHFGLYPHDVRETEVWNSLLQANYGLLMDALQRPHHLTAVLNIFAEMQRHGVQPYTHLTALCNLKLEGLVLLAATSRPRFINCLLSAGIFSKRVAKLILSRHENGDFPFSGSKFWMNHLKYLNECGVDLTDDHMSMLTRYDRNDLLNEKTND